ncbi:hypothetical protein PC39_02235 [Salinisphaera sp. PC39]
MIVNDGINFPLDQKILIFWIILLVDQPVVAVFGAHLYARGQTRIPSETDIAPIAPAEVVVAQAKIDCTGDRGVEDKTGR